MKQILEKRTMEIVKRILVLKEKQNSDFYYSPGLFHQPKRPKK